MSILSKQEYINGILEGNTVVLSRAITLLESSLENHNTLAREILDEVLPYTGNSKRIGITGVPGAGKSTTIESLGLKILENKNNKIAVLAIDPSSQLSKGSILGDKTRMEQLSTQANAYIRPTSTGTALGGVSRKTNETILLCEAAGYNYVIIETVGVGQNETAVHAMIDCFLLLLIPGAGDELQGIKRGIMEMADIIAINKSFEKEKIIPSANKARKEIHNALHYFSAKEFSWTTKILNIDALNGNNINSLLETIESFFNHQKLNGNLQEKRNQQNSILFAETLKLSVWQQFYNKQHVKEQLEKYSKDIQEGKITAYQAVEKILNDKKI